MVYLALSILSSSIIFVVFKLFVRYRVETFYAIVVNYLVAGTVATAFYKGEVAPSEIMASSWFIGTVCLGVLFIVVFNLMAATSQRLGVSVASVATKMSLAIPVVFGVLVYKEELGALKIIGIILALAAVYFTSIKRKSGKPLSGVDNSDREFPPSTYLVLPLLVFLGSGVIDTSIKYVQEYHIDEAEYPLFSATVFAAAAATGVLLVILKSFKGGFKVNPRNVLGGIALGVPNYFSIYFLLKALRNDTLNSASVFTINNVAIVMFTTLLGILLFKEQISTKNWGGIVLAVLSILLVAFF